jgi:hypothetical protein
MIEHLPKAARRVDGSGRERPARIDRPSALSLRSMRIASVRMREMCEWPLRFWWPGPHPLDGPVHGGSSDPEEFGELSLGVPRVVQLQQVLGLVRLELRLLSRSRPLALATFIPSLVRSRIRSDSNSATIASTLNNSRPTGPSDRGSSRRG